MTNYKKSKILLLILGLIIAIVGFMLADPMSIGLCNREELSCRSQIGEGIGQPLMVSGAAFVISIFILLFTSDITFNTWKKFVLVYIPLGALAIIMTPVSCTEVLPCPDKELVTWWIGGAYLVISLIIIIFKHLRSHKAFKK